MIERATAVVRDSAGAADVVAAGAWPDRPLENFSSTEGRDVVCGLAGSGRPFSLHLCSCETQT